MTIQKHTVMTSQQAIEAYNDRGFKYTGYQRVLFGELEKVLSIIERQQQAQAVNLLNSRGVRNESWYKVHQVVEDVTFDSVNPDLKTKLYEIEQKLRESGVAEFQDKH